MFVLMLAGCLPTYVGSPDTAKVDPDLVGVWHAKSDGDDEIWAVHKMNERNYLVQSYRVAKTGEEYAIKSTLTWRAWLAEIEGVEFVSLEVYMPELLLEDSKVSQTRYVVGRVDLKDDQLTIRSIDPKMLTGKEVTRPQQLEQLIKDNLKKDELYLEASKFTRVTAENKAKLSGVLDALK